MILVGNPCCDNASAIAALQAARPHLEIVTEGTDASPTTRDESDELEDIKPVSESGQFDVDELLKEIVQRKCKIQSLETMDIPHILHVYTALSHMLDIYRT